MLEVRLTEYLFRWINPLLGKGYKKDLEIEDIYQNLKADSSEDLGEQLQRWVYIHIRRRN